ncbi:MAG: helix-hairpin-helix domain-containing protein [Planctomycetota bacterium]|nr:helix-hairpin-helix domain-containing protein [Planctomycetota bacterium]
MGTIKLTSVAGIGPERAVLLERQGITSVKKLAKAKRSAIEAVHGIGPVTAMRAQASAQALLEAAAPDKKADAKKQRKDKKGDKTKKGRKGQKRKKGDKAKKDRKRKKRDKAKKGRKGKKGKKGKS